MSIVNLTNVVVHNNPGTWESELQFQIEFEVLGNLDDEVEWRLTYVGSPESSAHDQLLDSVLVGPMAPGAYQILFQADPPDMSLIPVDELLGVTGLLLSCHYRALPTHGVPFFFLSHARRGSALPTRPQARSPSSRSVTTCASSTTRLSSTRSHLPSRSRNGCGGLLRQTSRA